MNITTIGIDLAKTVFAVHGVNEHGRAVLKKIETRSGYGVLRKPISLSDWDGGVWERAPLGSQAQGNGTPCG